MLRLRPKEKKRQPLRARRKGRGSVGLLGSWARARWLLWLFMLAVLAFLLVSYQGRWFPIHRVLVVSGGQQVSVAAIQRLVRSELRGGFFSLDAVRLRRLLLRMPWVQSVTVRRVWPDSLRVSVGVNQAVAVWGKHQLLSAKGVLFGPGESSFSADLPRLMGPVASEQLVYRAYQDFSILLRPLHLQLTGLRLLAHRGWRLDIKQGGHIFMHQQQDRLRLRQFVVAYSQLVGKKWNKVERVDLRYAHGLAIAWKKRKHLVTR